MNEKQRDLNSGYGQVSDDDDFNYEYPEEIEFIDQQKRMENKKRRYE